MNKFLPSAEIINDLLAENWELRWRVFEAFYRTQLFLQDFSRSSQEYRQARELCREMANRLNGPSDINLHLVLSAAWFLGGTHFVLLILEKLGVDNPVAGDEETRKQKKPLNANHPGVGLFSYFHSLITRGKALDAAPATAIRIFPPAEAFRLITEIPEDEPRREAIRIFRQYHPESFFNRQLLSTPGHLAECPELIAFIAPPISEAEREIVTATAERLLASPDTRLVGLGLEAVGRLTLRNCRDRVTAHLPDPAAFEALTRMGDRKSCEKLLKEASSWRRGRRLQALGRLRAGLWNPAVREALREKVRKGNSEEKELALRSLTAAPDPDTIGFLLDEIVRCREWKVRKWLLKALASLPARAFTDASDSRDYADELLEFCEDIRLYPEITAAVARLPFSLHWANFLLTRINLPVQQAHYREIALCLATFADRPEIHRHLTGLLPEVDWVFSYRLLTRLAPHFNGQTIPILIKLLQDREEGRGLTIRERLTLGQNPEKFTDALAEFFVRQPAVANDFVITLTHRITTGTLPSPEELFATFTHQSAELFELVFDQKPGRLTAANCNLPRLVAWHLLSAIEVDGNDCFALVVHRTRRYEGFFRQRIIAVINRLLDHENELQDIDSLPVLQQVIDFIRGRPEFDTLRQRLLERITRITSHCRELKVFSEASQTRDLIVFKIRKLT